MLIQHKLLTAAVVEPLLRGRFGRPYLWSESCPSTQDVLRGTDLPEGAVALTEHQTSGRGREGRTWEDVAGTSLLLSLLLRPPAVLPARQELACYRAILHKDLQHARQLADSLTTTLLELDLAPKLASFETRAG